MAPRFAEDAALDPRVPVKRQMVTADSGEPPTKCLAMGQRSRGGAGPWHFAASQCSLPWIRLETIGPEQTASSLVLVAAATPGYAKIKIKGHGPAGETRRITLSQVQSKGATGESIYFAKMMLAPRVCVKSITLSGGPQPVIVKNWPDGDPQHCSKLAGGSQ